MQALASALVSRHGLRFRLRLRLPPKRRHQSSRVCDPSCLCSCFFSLVGCSKCTSVCHFHKVSSYMLRHQYGRRRRSLARGRADLRDFRDFRADLRDFRADLRNLRDLCDFRADLRDLRALRLPLIVAPNSDPSSYCFFLLAPSPSPYTLPSFALPVVRGRFSTRRVAPRGGCDGAIEPEPKPEPDPDPDPDPDPNPNPALIGAGGGGNGAFCAARMRRLNASAAFLKFTASAG